MTSSCVILLCSAIFCHLTLGYDNARYGKLGIAKLEAKNEENHVLNRTYNQTLGDRNNKKSSVATKSNISEVPAPEPERKTTGQTNNGDKTYPEPTSETSPVVNVNDTSPELTSETSPVVDINDTSPESTSETSPAVNVNDTSPEPTSETSPVVDVNDTSPEPTSEPEDKENEGESEPADEPDSEPGGEEEPTSESELDAFAEPGPDWVLAKEVWKGAWEFHVYFFGVAFALLGLYCLITLIRLWNMEHLISKNYFVILNLLVTLLCILRSIYLLLDAYNSLGTFPVGVDYFLYSTAFPCLTASFSILFYSLLLATRVRIMSKKVQKLWVLLVIVIFHFVLSIATDIVVGFFSSASVMILVCQMFFIMWGLLMFIGYFSIFRKLYKGSINHQKTLTGLHHEHKSPVLNGHGHQSKHKHTFILAMKVTCLSAVAGVAIVGFELYGMFGVYGALNADSKPEPWSWWTYHVIVRTLELLMCLSVTFVAGQPLRYKIKKNSNHRMYHYMLPCSMCCCPSNIEHNETVSSSVNRDFSLSRPARIAQEDSSNI